MALESSPFSRRLSFFIIALAFILIFDGPYCLIRLSVLSKGVEGEATVTAKYPPAPLFAKIEYSYAGSLGVTGTGIMHVGSRGYGLFSPGQKIKIRYVPGRELSPKDSSAPLDDFGYAFRHLGDFLAISAALLAVTLRRRK